MLKLHDVAITISANSRSAPMRPCTYADPLRSWLEGALGTLAALGASSPTALGTALLALAPDRDNHRMSRREFRHHPCGHVWTLAGNPHHDVNSKALLGAVLIATTAALAAVAAAIAWQHQLECHIMPWLRLQSTACSWQPVRDGFTAGLCKAGRKRSPGSDRRTPDLAFACS